MKKFTLAMLTISCLSILTACGDNSNNKATPVPQSADINAIQKRHDELLSQKQTLEAQKFELEKQLAVLQANANKENESIKKIQDQITALEENLKTTSEKFTNTNNQIAEAMQSEQKSKDALTALQNELGATERQLKDLQAENNKLKEDLTNAKMGNANSDTTAQDNEILSKTQNELKKVQEELEKTKEALKQAQNANNHHGNHNTDNATHSPTDATMPETMTNLASAFNTFKTNFRPERGTYTGIVVRIDNDKKTATGDVIAAKSGIDTNTAFSNFKIGDTTITLLNKDDDIVPTIRKLTAADFPDGDITNDNLGYIGSKYGNKSYDGFGTFRYGVYQDKDNQSHLFIYGNPTDKGVVERNTRSLIYKGSAIIGKDGQYRPLDKAVTAVLDAEKTKVDIDIKTDKGETLKFSGDIKYNNVAGVRFGGDGVSGKTEGGFFGYDSLGGIFEVLQDGIHKGENGVYGASNDSEVIKSHN